jgi:hypothetical protein
VGRKMKKLTPIQKLEKIVDDWTDNGKRYKKLTPYEMNMLIDVYAAVDFGHEFLTFNSAVANVAESLGFKVKEDEHKVNYEISV